MKNLPKHVSRMLGMLGQSLSRKRAFADIYDDRAACLALELCLQVAALVLSTCLTIVYGAYGGFPKSTTYVMFYWAFMMMHYFSVSNAVSRKEKLQAAVDIALFVYGTVSFLVFMTGWSTAQMAVCIIYWILVPIRYVTFIVMGALKLERMFVNTQAVPTAN